MDELRALMSRGIKNRLIYIFVPPMLANMTMIEWLIQCLESRKLKESMT